MTAYPFNQSDATIAARDFADEVGGAIGRVVVDADCFPLDAGQIAFELCKQNGNILPLVERRDHDGQLERNGLPIRNRVRRSDVGDKS